MKNMIFGLMSLFFSMGLFAQPIVQSFKILEDSVQIEMVHFQDNGGIYPMSTQCMTFKVNTEYTGVVIIEILGVCTNKMSNFRGYCHSGTIFSCTSAMKIIPTETGIVVNGIHTKYVRIRKDVRW